MKAKLRIGFLSCSKYLEPFDIYAKRINVPYKGKLKYSAISGIGLSFIFHIAFITISWGFISSKIHKNKLNSTSFLKLRDLSSDYFEYDFEGENSPKVAISWTHPELGDLLKSVEANLTLKSHVYTLNSDNWFKKNNEFESKKFEKGSQEEFSNVSSNFYCPPKDAFRIMTG